MARQLDPIRSEPDGGLVLSFPYVSGNDNLPATLERWLVHVARELLRLGVYFRALAILREIPGGARYRPIAYGTGQPLPQKDRACLWLGNLPPRGRLDVLAECLRRLGVAETFKGIREARGRPPWRLSRKWSSYLDRHAQVPGGLLHVVACCIDLVIVEPGLEEIDVKTDRWRRWLSEAE